MLLPWGNQANDALGISCICSEHINEQSQLIASIWICEPLMHHWYSHHWYLQLCSGDESNSSFVTPPPHSATMISASHQLLPGFLNEWQQDININGDKLTSILILLLKTSLESVSSNMKLFMFSNTMQHDTVLSGSVYHIDKLIQGWTWDGHFIYDCALLSWVKHAHLPRVPVLLHMINRRQLAVMKL